jgi:UDP-N-acetylmuramyl pentapeptide phosphotransferase/UDP-N-acetylglucosamine-1-phosphate transferase
MGTLIWLGLRAFAFSLILTPIIRDIFRVFELVDRPDSRRKTHAFPVPRVGGIAVLISYLLASYFTPALRADSSLSLVARLLPAILIIFTTGLIDDFVALKPWQKLVAETAAAALAYWAGARVGNVAGQPTLGWWSFLITIVWLVACTNAFNLVDGLDGLAAGIGLVSTLTIFVGALVEGNTALCIATLPLAGCLLAFLCFNFNPATIFLGDCGSLLVGFLLGCYGVVWSQKSLTMFGMTAPLIVLSVPLLDVGLSIFRRILRRQPIFSADRSHIHHRLIDRGLSQRQLSGRGAFQEFHQQLLAGQHPRDAPSPKSRRRTRRAEHGGPAAPRRRQLPCQVVHFIAEVVQAAPLGRKRRHWRPFAKRLDQLELRSPVGVSQKCHPHALQRVVNYLAHGFGTGGARKLLPRFRH